MQAQDGSSATLLHGMPAPVEQDANNAPLGVVSI
jgi:hypothetical protein